MFVRRSIWLGSTALLILLSAGCVENLPLSKDRADVNVSESKDALSRLDGQLTVEIEYSGTSERELIMHVGDRQYGLAPSSSGGSCTGSTSSGSYAVSCTWVEDYDSAIDTDQYTDHPFVDNADDWDHITIQNSSGVDVQVSKLLINSAARGIDNESAFGTGYDFVDKEFSSAKTVSASQSWALADLIQERRECVAKSTVCGADGGNVCYDDSDPCTRINNATGGNLTVGDVDLESTFPRMVLKKIEDIGQSGTKKIIPFSYSSPCTELYTYYAQQYANGFYSG